MLNFIANSVFIYCNLLHYIVAYRQNFTKILRLILVDKIYGGGFDVLFVVCSWGLVVCLGVLCACSVFSFVLFLIYLCERVCVCVCARACGFFGI